MTYTSRIEAHLFPITLFFFPDPGRVFDGGGGGGVYLFTLELVFILMTLSLLMPTSNESFINISINIHEYDNLMEIPNE